VIPFEDAAAFIGETVIVEGAVTKTHNSGKAVFLNFSPDYKAFKAVIFADDLNKFPPTPEQFFLGKRVRIEGLVKEYQGAPEIIITEPGQLEVALIPGQPIATPPACVCDALPTPPVVAAMEETGPGTPLAEAAAAQETTVKPIAWQDAAAYAGQHITVQGTVINTYNSGKVVFLNFHQDYQNSFKVAIFADAWPLFDTPPETLFLNKTVQVSGPVKIYQNAPEIIVDHPSQIELVE
jgi:DNA/RNA endonuclease YhcR with UshA esterase domain